MTHKGIKLILTLPSDIYWGLKKGAKQSYCSITSYVVRALLDRFNKESVVVSDKEKRYFEEDRLAKCDRIYKARKANKEAKKDAETN
jgi:hypothetical protein